MEIKMGALCPKLSEQLPGLDEKYDKFSDAITLLTIQGILTDSETHKARKRLIKKMEKDPTY